MGIEPAMMSCKSALLVALVVVAALCAAADARTVRGDKPIKWNKPVCRMKVGQLAKLGHTTVPDDMRPRASVCSITAGEFARIGGYSYDPETMHDCAWFEVERPTNFKSWSEGENVSVLTNPATLNGESYLATRTMKSPIFSTMCFMGPDHTLPVLVDGPEFAFETTIFYADAAMTTKIAGGHSINVYLDETVAVQDDTAAGDDIEYHMPQVDGNLYMGATTTEDWYTTLPVTRDVAANALAAEVLPEGYGLKFTVSQGGDAANRDVVVTVSSSTFGDVTFASNNLSAFANGPSCTQEGPIVGRPMGEYCECKVYSTITMCRTSFQAVPTGEEVQTAPVNAVSVFASYTDF